jgi:hypothetical protein
MVSGPEMHTRLRGITGRASLTQLRLFGAEGALLYEIGNPRPFGRRLRGDHRPREIESAEERC